ncbi:MAG: winged helix DNA-binding domain-containing protein [Microlunatus sp.]|nr:winged helix DNA-binding domain-containing protein [Microlunatus sp.]
MNLTRDQVIRHRIAAQQLDREPGPARSVTDAAVLDLGVQDSGRDGASWALANRGVPISSPVALADTDDLVLAWTVRVSPHYYRRAEIADVMKATSPFDDDDAGRRMVGAAKHLATQGVDAEAAVAEVAKVMRRRVGKPTAKGELSAAVTEQLPAAYGAWCRPCHATHVPESLFRMAALFGGLEIEPATSPPVLRRIPGWPQRPAGPASDPDSAPKHLQPIRGYLRLLGPATPADVAGFLDTTATVIKAHWPDDAIEVRVDGKRKWLVGEVAEPEPVVRLLGPYDLLAQGKDRELLVPDTAHRKQLWPMLGRPGSLLVDGEIAGSWRPRAKGKKLDLEVEQWRSRAVSRQRLTEQAERLADHRGLSLGSVSPPS